MTPDQQKRIIANLTRALGHATAAGDIAKAVKAYELENICIAAAGRAQAGLTLASISKVKP